MTNLYLIKNWHSLGIKFKSSKETSSLSDMFLICVGETELDVSGIKERVVAFYQGYDEKGSPAVFFTSDDNDRCWTFAHKNDTHIKSNIGSFVTEIPIEELAKRNKKRKSKVKTDLND